MNDWYRFLINRLRERLWVRPLATCLLSIGGVALAKALDGSGLEDVVPRVTAESIETLLRIMAAGMLVIATFAVAAMVSAYGSASTTATPRSFSLVIADDVSQTALSAFIGAFIFSVVAITALKNNYFGIAGRFVLFVVTGAVFAIVILTFVRWVDRIARLGRLGSVIDKVESAAAASLRRRAAAPHLHGTPPGNAAGSGRPVEGTRVGYVRRIDVGALQAVAKRKGSRISVAALPGTFVAPGRALVHVHEGAGSGSGEGGDRAATDAPESDDDAIREAFQIGDDRIFDDDPRFGLVVLSEVASRALSPGINDPGTAIQIIGTLVRLFVVWSETSPPEGADEPRYDRVEVPALSVPDMFDDAFTGIARDGAGQIEVGLRLQKGFRALAATGDERLREAARHHARLALGRAELALTFPEDLEAVRRSAAT